MKYAIQSRGKYVYFLLLLTLFLFYSCGKDALKSDAEKQADSDDNALKSYIANHNIQAQKHSSGFYYEVMTSNPSGDTLGAGDVVDFYYKISVLNGPLIDKTDTSTGKPSRFKLLYRSILPVALDYGIRLMKVGERYRFYVPSYLAFGNYEDSLFSANSSFIIEAQVVGKHTDTQIDDSQIDSIDHYVKARYANYEKYATGLYRIDSVVGTGAKPFDGDHVTFNYVEKYLDNTVIASSNNASFYIGYGQAIAGLEEGLRQMHGGGRSTLIMPASEAFQQSLCVVPEKIRKNLYNQQIISTQVLPYSIIVLEIDLQSVN